MYSLGDDLKVNNQMLKRIRDISKDQDSFIFDPNLVRKVGIKWDIHDFELNYDELQRWG